jgi:putative ABC transport system permease protein
MPSGILRRPEEHRPSQDDINFRIGTIGTYILDDFMNKIFHPFLARVGRRYLAAHPWQTILMVLGIALGVGVMVAIDLANASASRAFELSTQALTGKATHQILGGPNGVEAGLYTRLVQSGLISSGAVVAASPNIGAYVTSPQLGDAPMQLIGIDPFSDVDFQSYLSRSQNLDFSQLGAFLTRPGAVLLSREVAQKYGLHVGDALTIDVSGNQKSGFVAGILEPADSLARRSLDGAMLADIATVQALTGRNGWLDEIDLILPANGADKIAAWLPSGYQLAVTGQRSGSIEQMTAAFQLNLTALSLLALVVGLFLIYNTMTFAVVQRRELFGTLRCLGATRSEIFWMVAGEAGLVGVTGSLLGLGLGILLGRETVNMVSQTINDLYYTTTVQSVGISTASLVRGFVLGTLATILTAALPAWEAASVPPRAALLRSGLEKKTRRNVTILAGAGAAAILIGGAFLSLPKAGLIGGFGGTLVVVVGFAMLAAFVMTLLLRWLRPVLGKVFGLLGRIAPGSLINSLSRTSVAVAALMVAVAVSIGMTLMIDSFRHTVTVWLETSLQGDVYVSAPAFKATTPVTPLDPAVVTRLANWPGTRQIDYLRSAMIETRQGQAQVNATTNSRIGQERIFLWSLQSPKEQGWAALQGGAVMVSEPLARRLGLLVGTTRAQHPQIELLTAHGWKTYPVFGIYYDYTSSQGTLLMAHYVFSRDWNDTAVTSISLRLQPGVDPDAVTAAVEQATRDIQRVQVRPNLALRREVLAVFDRTFAITNALRLLATVVAFIGILNTLLLLEMEKRRETGILRALGLTGRQLWRLVMLETGLMGFSAGLLAMPTGYALALILIYVINQRSFGWTLQISLSYWTFGQALLVSITAALLAGVLPARRLSRMPAAEVIRYE